MIHRSISQLSLDSVVFENRNQSYGAYDLRSVYNLHLIRSLIIALFFCGSFFGSVYIAGQFLPVTAISAPPVVVPDIIEVILQTQKHKGGPPAPPAQRTQVTTASTAHENTNYVPAAEIDPTTIPVDLPSIENDGPVEPGEIKGGIPGGTGISDTPGENGLGNSDGLDDKVLNYAEVLPEFEGGKSAMYEYLSSHLKYPPMAHDTEGKVLVTFVINKHGQVDQVEVIKSIHPLLDAEAERVIKSMPLWKPGKQHGRPVNVRMVIPIAFKMN